MYIDRTVMTNNLNPFLIIIIGAICFLSCSSSETVTTGKLPPSTAQSPRYQTDEVLAQRIDVLKRQLTATPNDENILLEIASLHQELNQDSIALSYMVQLKELDFRKDPRLYGSMAQIYRNQEEFANAKEHYEYFRELLPNNSATIQKIDHEIEELDFIIRSLAKPFDIRARPFSTDVNTQSSEYLPQFTMDDSVIIFTRRFFDQEDLFIATKSEDGFTVNAIDELNTLGNEGAHTLSADGQLLIFTQCHPKQGFGNCDLYRSRRLPSGKWSKPANMGQRINSRSWDSQPSLSADGRTLYFASKRSGGYGGSDIYVSRKRRDGTWTVPQNIGSEVNTPQNDEAPFIHADGRTMYFRSRGYIGHGNYDLYRATYDGNTWQDVTNLGSPINSTGEDGALVVSLDGTRGYYSTDILNGNKLDHLDLYEFDLPYELRPQPMTFVKGRVTDKESGMPLQAEIRIASLNDQKHRSLYRANYNGEFLAAIPVGVPILINIHSDDYVFYSDHVYYEEVKYSVNPYKLYAELSKPEIAVEDRSEPVILKNIFFESGSANLLPQSESEITILYGLLQDQPYVRIRIIGHTDDVGNDEDNLSLSQQRAEAVKRALVEKGIKPDRIVATGMGETSPIDSNDTDEGRANNRRTEFEIIK